MKTSIQKDPVEHPGGKARFFSRFYSRFRFFPNSLGFRLFLLIFAGVLLATFLSALLAFSVAQRERVKVIQHFHGHEAADRITDVAILLSALPPPERGKVVASLSRRGNEWQILPLDSAPSGEADAPLVRRLNNRMHGAATAEEAWSDADVPVSRAPWQWKYQCEGDKDDKCGKRKGEKREKLMGFPSSSPAYQVRLAFPDGEKIFLRYRSDERHRPVPIAEWRLPTSMGLFVLLLALVSWFAVRFVLRPLRRMVRALDEFGRNIDQAPLDPRGPSEVRQAAQAFNAMQERIRGYMTERTQILAAVTHDLKTPLTRMRLRIEQCADENLKERLESDIAAMQALISDGLELARSMERNEEMQALDLGALLQSLADDAAGAGQGVQYEETESAEGEAEHVRIQGNPGALQRLFGNLVDNAVKYGSQARIRLVREERTARVLIRDGGPGIPESFREEVQKPCFRLAVSRSRETGGTGLGLAIALNLAAAHNAKLELRNHPEGGLEANVIFPL